MKWKQYKNICV